MKTLLFSFLLTSSVAAVVAAPVTVTDPAADQRCHAAIGQLNGQTGKYEKFLGDALVLDGNESTGRDFSAGRHQFLLTLSKARQIDRLSILGSGSVRFTVSIANDLNGERFTVAKNLKPVANWMSERPVNKSAQYIFIEADAASQFNLNEFAVYGVLPPVAGGPRYLSEIWGRQRSEPAPEPIYQGPKTRFIPGKLGFPSRMSDSRSLINQIRTPAATAPQGRIGVPPKAR